MQAHAAYAPFASLGSYLECADYLGKFLGTSYVPACGLKLSTASSTMRSERELLLSCFVEFSEFTNDLHGNIGSPIRNVF